jgi:hypothetical protein
MPRYVFHLTGARIVKDLVGTELANDAAARQEATLRSINGSGFRLQQYRDYNFVEVQHESRRVVCKIRIQHSS